MDTPWRSCRTTLFRYCQSFIQPVVSNEYANRKIGNRSSFRYCSRPLSVVHVSKTVKNFLNFSFSLLELCPLGDGWICRKWWNDRKVKLLSLYACSYRRRQGPAVVHYIFKLSWLLLLFLSRTCSSETNLCYLLLGNRRTRLLLSLSNVSLSLHCCVVIR